jgi:hypothetical protein
MLSPCCAERGMLRCCDAVMLSGVLCDGRNAVPRLVPSHTGVIELVDHH